MTPAVTAEAVTPVGRPAVLHLVDGAQFDRRSPTQPVAARDGLDPERRLPGPLVDDVVLGEPAVLVRIDGVRVGVGRPVGDDQAVGDKTCR